MDEDRLAEILAAAFEKLGMGDFGKNMGQANKNMTEAQKKAKKQEDLIKAVNKRFEELDVQLKKGRKQYVDLGSDLKVLNEAIEDVTDPIKKQRLEVERNILAQKFLSEQYQKAGVDISKAVSQTLVKGIWNSTKTLVRDLQSGGSGVQLAADLMTTALDTNQSVITGVAETGRTLGTAMEAAGGKTAKWGGRLAVASTAIEFFTSAVTAAAKEGVKLLADEADKTIKAFNNATAAGALFANGMDDVRHYASKAGLTVDQFSNVLKNNSNELARAGYTVTEGAKIVGNVTSRFAVQTGKSGQTLQREMLNLGLGFEEQANLTAQIVSDLKRSGGTATNGQVASATADIAKNMKAVADIMGEEYKARQDAAKKAAEQYAFQAKINEIARRTNDPGLPKRVELAMSLMSESNRQAAIQATVLGGAVTNVAANLTGGADAGRDFANALTSGKTSMQDLTHGTAVLNDKFQSGTSDMGTAISRATIATGDLADISQAYDQQQQDSFKANSANIDKALKDADTLAGAHGGLQDQLMGVEVQAQKLKISIQDKLTPTIERFGKVANQVLDGVQKAVNSLSGKSGGSTDTIGSDVAKVGLGAELLGGALFGIGTILDFTGIGAAAGVPMQMAGGALMSGGGTALTAGMGMDMLGFAEGGVASGPSSGYSTTLHGTEAVVPLPDGRTIPVKLDSGDLTSAIQSQSGILHDILRAMKDNNGYASRIAQNTN